MTSPTQSSGTDSVTSMIGSSSTASACSSASRIASDAGELEGHLGGVDRVVGAVEAAARARP